MTLAALLDLIAAEAADCGPYESAVMSRLKNADGSYTANAESFPILEVVRNDGGKEVNLLCGEPADEPSSISLTVEAVAAQLRSYFPSCADWGVFSGSPRERINSQWDIRYDVPIVAIGVNHEARMVAFLQWPPEQWGSAA